MPMSPPEPLCEHARVSVVIPCYRDAATLGRALASLQSQTKRADEVIVVDDCSPEGELIRQVIAGFPGTIYLRNAENLGLAGTRNRGLQEATGDVVAFLDGIFALAGFISHLIGVGCDGGPGLTVNYLVGHPEGSFLGHPVYTVGVDGFLPCTDAG